MQTRTPMKKQPKATTTTELTPRGQAKATGQSTYWSNHRCPQGHVGLRRTINGSCCACSAAKETKRVRNREERQRANRKWNASNKGYEAKRAWRDRDPINAWACSATGSARERARRYALPIDIDKNYVRSIVPAVCPVFGTPFEFLGKRLRPESPSLDRIDPAKGYVRGNVAIISLRANAIKSNACWQDIQRVADWLRNQE